MGDKAPNMEKNVEHTFLKAGKSLLGSFHLLAAYAWTCWTSDLQVPVGFVNTCQQNLRAMFQTTWTDEPKHEVDLTKNHVIYSCTDRLHQPRPPLLRPPLFCLSGFICSLLSCILLPTLLLQDAAFLLIPFRNPDDHISSK